MHFVRYTSTNELDDRQAEDELVSEVIELEEAFNRKPFVAADDLEISYERMLAKGRRP